MDWKTIFGLGDKLDAKGILGIVRNFLPLFLPQILNEIGQKLRNKDANSTGADDALGQIVQAAAGPLTEFVSGGTLSGTATDKAMSAIYDVAKNYRMAKGLPL